MPTPADPTDAAAQLAAQMENPNMSSDLSQQNADDNRVRDLVDLMDKVFSKDGCNAYLVLSRELTIGIVVDAFTRFKRTNRVVAPRLEPSAIDTLMIRFEVL